MKAMSRILGFAAAAALVLGAAAALAEVSVTGEVDKTKIKYVTETITIQKTITITPTVDVKVDSAAESQVVKNQDGKDLQSNENPEFGAGNTAVAVLEDAINGFQGEDPSAAAGVFQGNQSPGALNNQANELSLGAAGSLGEEAPGTGTFVHSEVALEQFLGDGDDAGIDGNSVIANYSANLARVIDSFSDIDGVIGLNQGAGDINNQNNSVSMAVTAADPAQGTGGVFALGEIDLGQANSRNSVSGLGHYRTTAIASEDLQEPNDEDYDPKDGSFSGVSGIVGVNQASGYLNNQANAVNVAVGTNPLP